MTDKATIEARVPRKGLQSGVLREYTIVGKVKPGHEKAVRDALTSHLTDPRRFAAEGRACSDRAFEVGPGS